MRATSLSSGKRRKGVILLVVLAMITLLTILGITFVLYSDASEATARISMEAEKFHQPDWTADQLMQIAFGQLVFDVEDDEAGQRSGLRGHSLARDMYGYRYGPGGIGLNDRPFRGTGRLEQEKPLLNFTTFYQNQGGSLVPDPIRDPERIGTRNNPNVPNPYAGGFNPPYTYADMNHVFLAKLGADGQVDEPSFVRREAMGSTDRNAFQGPLGSFDGNNWNFSAQAWLGQTGKYNMVRPRSLEHPSFPPPLDGWGDVRNLPWSTRNDAVWIDLGVEPRTANSGKKYKPMFAFTILDLDGRVNVNAHGNIHGRDGQGQIAGTHSSRDGIGPWEVSLARALSQGPGDTTWQNLFLGANGVTGRHNSNGTLGGFLIQNLNPQHTHGPLDGNAGQENAIAPLGSVPQPLALPGAQTGSPVSPLGRFVAEVYGGMGTNEVSPFHEAMFHPYFESSGNKLFSHSHLGLLMGRSARSPYAWQNSDFTKLVFGLGNDPFAPIGTGTRDSRYDRITTLSWDLDRPGMVPYLTDPGSQSLTYNPANWVPFLPGQAITSNIPGVDYPNSTPISFPNFPLNIAQNTGEFDPLGQSTLALFKKLNLRRYMTSFPEIDPNTGIYTDPANIQQAQMAVAERQQFAFDIYQHLCKATGTLMASDPGFPGPGLDPKYQASKWLAQLAANIVDYFDHDEVMTVFNWGTGPADAVYGVELSRLAINELYVQVENDPSDIGQKEAKKNYKAKLYLELVNPLLPNPGNDNHFAYLKLGTRQIHSIELVKKSGVSLRNISQPLGIVGKTNPGALIAASDWTKNNSPSIFVMPYGDGSIPDDPLKKSSSKGFLIVGPKPDSSASDLSDPRFANDFAGTEGDIVHQSIEFTIPLAKEDKNNSLLKTVPQDDDIPMVLLRRLAIPGLLENDPTQPTFDPTKPINPFVTIDLAQVTRDMLLENDARKVIDDAVKPGNQQNNNENEIGVSNRVSYGRSQPFFCIPAIAFSGNLLMEKYGTLIPQFPKNQIPNSPKYTFWKHNFRDDTLTQGNFPPITYPFIQDQVNPKETFETPKFRPHLDRWPSTVGEVLSVPTCRAHEIILLNNQRADFVAGWHDPATRLYRFLELAQAGSVRNLQLGTAPIAVGAEGGRIPGKINVNTMTRDVFKALCDPQDPTNPTTALRNRFSEGQVEEIWKYIEANRPFWGFGMGEAVVPDSLGSIKRGMNQSLLRRHSGGPVQFNPLDGPSNDPTDLINLMLDPQNANNNLGVSPPIVPGTSRLGQMPLPELPPNVRQELLSKILGNTTSRSNCFAVWVTVGYFEVISEQGNPSAAAPKYILGQEMQPRARRRMFALIDRTQLEAWKIQLVGFGPANPLVQPSPSNILDQNSGLLTSEVQVPLSSLSYISPNGQTLIWNGASGSVIQGRVYPVDFKIPGVKQGSILTFDPGTFFEETVEVEDLGNNNPGVKLRKPHGLTGPVVVCSRGNPGPIPRENIDLDDLKGSGLIPYFQVLE